MPNVVVMEAATAALTYFEAKYTCSGFCNPGLFYYSLDLTEGIPTTSCLIYLKTEIGDSLTYLGVTSIICGVLMCLVFAFQYMLWFPVEDESGDYRNNRQRE